jgi:hypothetical protein
VEALAHDTGKSVSSVIRRLIAEAYRERFGESPHTASSAAVRNAVRPIQGESEVGVTVPEQARPARVRIVPDALLAFHRDVLGRDPTPAQRTIYEAGARGLVGRHSSPEQLEAMVVVAMKLAERGEVFVFAPRVVETEVTTAIKSTVASAITATSGRQGSRERVKELVHRLRPWTHFPPEHEPVAWVSLGFERNDPVPAWLKQGLVVAPDPRADLNNVGPSIPTTPNAVASP